MRNSRYKVVICEYFGVMSTPVLYKLAKTEWDYGVPRGFLINLLKRDDPDKPSSKMLLGKVTLSEMIPLLKEQVFQAAKANKMPAIVLSNVIDEFLSSINDLKVNIFLLRSLQRLRNLGYKTCLLANTWINDYHSTESSARMKLFIKSNFDYFYESNQIQLVRPDTQIYHYALDQMGFKPEEAISIEAVEAYAAAAQSIGITAILAVDQPTIIQKLENIFQVNLKTIPRPPAATENNVIHGQVVTKIPYLAKLGYRAIALDLRGFGQSSCPPGSDPQMLILKTIPQIKLCRQVHTSILVQIVYFFLAQDVIDTMDSLFIHKAILIGHDLGSIIAWFCALHFPDRVEAVGSLNVPYKPQHRYKNFLQHIKKNPRQFDYQFYYQQEGKAEAELEKDYKRTFNVYLGDYGPISWLKDKVDFSTVRKRGGILVGLPEELPDTPFLTEEEMQEYIKTFKQTGFRPGLNYYRTYPKTWKWNLKFIGRQVSQPALIVVAEYDNIFRQGLVKNMEKYVPNLTTYSLDCGHCIQFERPGELNEILRKWLEKVCPSPSISLGQVFSQSSIQGNLSSLFRRF
ncbi:Bifunctional epoxide hydrolase 2 [Trichoplax sp. H2]|nr:Bifunctional epoxide hydrolase 2 [Trichoplax sp. H2]|eukprot:RDD39733.1 Bifunctional epoxide hydrolase 2 [Trichoplax sp. H2]